MRIWKDPWLYTTSTRKPITPRNAYFLIRVSDLINPVTGDWDIKLVQDIFWPEYADEMLQIPIGVDMEDWPAK